MIQIARLKSRALLSLSGGDTKSFLQNLITCDLDGLQDGNLTFGALLTPQGKVLFDFFVLRENGGFVLDIDSVQLDAIHTRLSFYRLRANVDICTDKRGVFAAWGATELAGITDPRNPGLGNRIYTGNPVTNADEDVWHENRIRIGMPHSGKDFELQTVFPHDILMDQFPGAGIAFTKGCYVGQEVVSRMQHRGPARNRFMKVRAVSPDCAWLPTTGAEIFSNSRKIGTMGSSVGPRGLALVRVDRAKEAVVNKTPLQSGGLEIIIEPPEFVHYENLA